MRICSKKVSCEEPGQNRATCLFLKNFGERRCLVLSKRVRIRAGFGGILEILIAE